MRTNFSVMRIKIQNFSFMKMHVKMSSAKGWPFCPGSFQYEFHFSKQRDRDSHWKDKQSWDRLIVIMEIFALARQRLTPGIDLCTVPDYDRIVSLSQSNKIVPFQHPLGKTLSTFCTFINMLENVLSVKKCCSKCVNIGFQLILVLDCSRRCLVLEIEPQGRVMFTHNPTEDECRIYLGNLFWLLVVCST